MKGPTFILISILFLGAVLRIAGINFGLPDIYHADEQIIVNHALAYGTGDLNPHFFAIPPLLSYVLFLSYSVYFLVGFALGKFHSTTDFALAFLRDPTALYLIGRLVVGALCGVLTTLTVYKFAKKIFSEPVALLSALFLAVCFIHVQNSHYIYADIPMVLFVMLTCYAATFLMEKPSLKNYLLVGFLSGAACAIKYNAILVFLIIPASWLVTRDKGCLIKTCASVLAAIAAFVILNPYSLLDYPFFINSVLTQAGTEFPLGFLYHFRYSLREGIGIFLILLGILGMLLFAVKDKRHMVFLVFPAAFYLHLALFSQPHERYCIPLVPFLLIYSSAFIFARIKNKIFFSLVVLFALIPNLEKSLYSDLLFMKKDTRTLAREWVEKNVPANSSIALEHSFFCPHLKQAAGQISEKMKGLKATDSVKRTRLEMELKIREGGAPAYNLFYLKDDAALNTGFLFEKPQLPFSLKTLKNDKIEYVILHVDRENNVRDNFYVDIQNNAFLLAEFSPYINKDRKFAHEKVVQTAGPFATSELLGRSRNGYIIRIFKLN